MVIKFFFSILCISLTFTGNFMSLKSRFLGKSLSAFVIIAEWWSEGCKYLTKHHLKHSLLSKFWIYLGWSNSFGNLI